MQKYELTLVLDGKVSPAKKKVIVASIEKIITTFKGKLGKADEWGERNLFTKIGKSESGFYLHFPLELERSSVKGFNLKLKMEGDIIRHLLVRKDTEK